VTSRSPPPATAAAGNAADVIAAPRHPYTQGLLRSLPHLDDLDRPIEPIAGQVPDLTAPEAGCRFLARCTLRREACAAPVPMHVLPGGRAARCVLAAAP
jgi:oligopeptide/dipeptide ABC transporter ATP-binding protein